MPVSSSSAEVRLHDFRTPPPLSLEHAAAMRAFQERFADAMRGLLTPVVREIVDAEVGACSLFPAEDAAAHFALPGVRFRCNLGDAAASTAILEFAPDVAGRIVDRLCGGAAEAAITVTTLTGIEQALLGELLTRALPLLGESLRELIAASPRDLGYAPAIDTAWLAGAGEHVVVAPLTVRCGPVSGQCAVVFPLALLGATPQAVVTAPGANERALMRRHVLAVEVPVAARIAFRVPALQIASMREGTVIATGHPSHGVVEVTTGGRRRFVGMLGREQEHVAVRLLREAAEDENNNRSNRRNQAP